MPPKKKGQRMELEDFLNGEGGVGSWADEDIPAAGGLADWGTSASSGLGGSTSLGSGFISDREPVPLPTAPPYTARIFNLPYDASDAGIRQFFSVDQKLAVSSVRVPKDMDTGRIKGYAFVEFDDVESLARAVKLEGVMFSGRPLRISVAEPRGEQRYDDDWRSARRGPLDPIERGGRGGGFGGAGRGGFRGDAEPDLDWSTRRGPLAPENEGPRGERFGTRAPRHIAPAEENLDWSVRRDLGPPRRPRGPTRERERDEPALDWGARRDLPARAPRTPAAPRADRTPERNFDEWSRGARAPTARTAPQDTKADAAPARRSGQNIQRGFAVLNDNEDDDEQDKVARPEAAPEAAPVKPRPMAETIAAQTSEAASNADPSWTVASGGKH